MSETTKIYYTRTSVGDRHWVTGQAYPENDGWRHDPPKVMEFKVDAFAVYGGPAPRGVLEIVDYDEDEDLEDGHAASHDELQLEEPLPPDGEQTDQPPQIKPHWGVHMTDPPEGTGHWFNLDIEEPGPVGSERYQPLVDALEARLGRTGLMILVH